MSAEYSVESLQHLILSQHSSTSVEAIAALRAFQERIKADEGAVTDEAVERAIVAYARTASKHIPVSAACMRRALLAVWPTPPAQAAQDAADEARDTAITDAFDAEHPFTTAEPAAQGEVLNLREAAEEALVLLEHLDPQHGITVQLRAVLAAQPRAVPDGWALVPREPTDAMCDAGDLPDTATAYDIYKAMLSAAPSPGESS